MVSITAHHNSACRVIVVVAGFEADGTNGGGWNVGMSTEQQVIKFHATRRRWPRLWLLPATGAMGTASDCAVTDTSPAWMGLVGTVHQGAARVARVVAGSRKNLAAAHMALVVATAEGGGQREHRL